MVQRSEIHALLTMHQLIRDLDAGGVLSRHLQPMLDKLTGMLGANAAEVAQMMKRVRIVGAAARTVPSRQFELAGAALQRRRQLRLRYRTRSRNETSERIVSPQRLVHYRSTWYLDAWCHRTDALRRFALDAVERAGTARRAGAGRRDEERRGRVRRRLWHLRRQPLGHATLVFDAEPAQWVAHEAWHPAPAGPAAGRQPLRTAGAVPPTRPSS